MKQSWVMGTVVAGMSLAMVTTLSMGGLATPVSAQQLSGNVNVPQGAEALGSIELPRQVMANGQSLAAGTYEVHLTGQTASGSTTGALPILERWVEFRQGSDVRGREVVTIVPQAEIADVAKSTPPGSGMSRVEFLRENEYLRVWINQGGTHFLIHLAVG